MNLLSPNMNNFLDGQYLFLLIFCFHSLIFFFFFLSFNQQELWH